MDSSVCQREIELQKALNMHQVPSAKPGAGILPSETLSTISQQAVGSSCGETIKYTSQPSSECLSVSSSASVKSDSSSYKTLPTSISGNSSVSAHVTETSSSSACFSQQLNTQNKRQQKKPRRKKKGSQNSEVNQHPANNSVSGASHVQPSKSSSSDVPKVKNQKEMKATRVTSAAEISKPTQKRQPVGTGKNQWMSSSNAVVVDSNAKDLDKLLLGPRSLTVSAERHSDRSSDCNTVTSFSGSIAKQEQSDLRGKSQKTTNASGKPNTSGNKTAPTSVKKQSTQEQKQTRSDNDKSIGLEQPALVSMTNKVTELTEALHSSSLRSSPGSGLVSATSSVTQENAQQKTPASDIAEAEAALQKTLEDLEAEHIFTIKKKTPRKDLKFICRLCDYHCTGVESCHRHLKDNRHKRLKKMKDEEQFLYQLGHTSKKHEIALTSCLMNLYNTVSASDEDYMLREKAFVQLKKIVNRIAPEAIVTVYGSFVSGFMLSTSDMNVDIQTDDAARLLTDLLEHLRADKSGLFQDVISDFSTDMPSINVVTSGKRSFSINIVVNNCLAVQTSMLLSVYSRLDSRVQPLVVAFRYWAKICKVDKQAEGSLPGYVYGLMVIYYLQQCKPPVLPVLHELLTQDEKQQCADPADMDYVYLKDLRMVMERWRCDNKLSVGCLWLNMLRFYCLEMNTNDWVVCIRQKAILRRTEKKWTSKKLAIEDPFYRKRNIARSLSHSQVYEYITDRLRAAFKYFGALPTHPQKAPDVIFEFNENTLGDQTGPDVICSTCQKEGHLKRECPQDRLPPLLPLPPLNRRNLEMLDRCLCVVPADFEPREADIRLRESVVKELLGVIRKTYPKASLRLFGSSCNGFGFSQSDLDITLTFEGCPTSEGINCVQIIETLAKSLKKQPGLYQVLPITTAKVPIVKFKHARSRLEGDISLYNTLAQHNTRMLQTYASIDKRVKILGYVMKVFAKCADICDASRGSLSSYAYVLMVIYFLQQRKPPVIPVLQELHGDRKPEEIVDKWNAWFFEDLKQLPRVWPGLNKNRESVAELWIGLLRFYTEEFRFNEHVICIRRLVPLTKFEKMWNKFGIAIEDPFNLDHNLGSGLSRRMSIYIQKVLRRGRKLFGTPIDSLPSNCSTQLEYYFDSNRLTDGAPPNDRCCRRCGKIGHFVNECPSSGGRSASRSNQPEQKADSDSGTEEEEEKEETKTRASAREKSEAAEKTSGKTEPVERNAVQSKHVTSSSTVSSKTPTSLAAGQSLYVFNSSQQIPSQVLPMFGQISAAQPFTVAAAAASYKPVVASTPMFCYIPVEQPLIPLAATQPCLAAPVAANEARNAAVPRPVTAPGQVPNSFYYMPNQSGGIVSQYAGVVPGSVGSQTTFTAQAQAQAAYQQPNLGRQAAVSPDVSSFTMMPQYVMHSLPMGAMPTSAFLGVTGANASAAAIRTVQGQPLVGTANKESPDNAYWQTIMSSLKTAGDQSLQQQPNVGTTAENSDLNDVS